jgi:hypothetical protein
LLQACLRPLRVPFAHRYQLCPTYPSALVLPNSLDRDCITSAASFRSKRRLPAVVWVHPENGAPLCRCAQPKTGMSGRWLTRTFCSRTVNAQCTHICAFAPTLTILHCYNLTHWRTMSWMVCSFLRMHKNRIFSHLQHALPTCFCFRFCSRSPSAPPQTPRTLTRLQHCIKSPRKLTQLEHCTKSPRTCVWLVSCFSRSGDSLVAHLCVTPPCCNPC